MDEDIGPTAQSRAEGGGAAEARGHCSRSALGEDEPCGSTEMENFGLKSYWGA